MKVTLTKVSSFTTNKDGAPLMGKNGKPYTRVMINTQEHGEKSLSGFGNQTTALWQEGQTVEVVVKEVVSNGNTYLNFDVPKAGVVGLEELKGQLKYKFSKLDAQILELQKAAGITGDPEGIDKAFAAVGAQPEAAPIASPPEQPVDNAPPVTDEGINPEDIPW